MVFDSRFALLREGMVRTIPRNRKIHTVVGCLFREDSSS